LSRVPAPLPRAYVVGRARTGSNEEALGFLLDPHADHQDAVVLAEGASVSSPMGFAGLARETGRRPDALEIEVEASAPGYLVLVEGYDPGWKASVDGRPVPVRRANVAFRAVAVPEGQHTVRLWYRSPALEIGGAASVATLATVLLGLAWRRARSGAASERPGGE
jgi:hypothetical protein